MIGYPIDSRVTFNEGIPEYDRAVSSAPLRELIKRLFSDGVLPDKSNDLLVQYVGSTRISGDIEGDINTYNVVVNPGFGICNGCLKLQENPYVLEMDTTNTTHPRIDTVVLRLNDDVEVRTCTFDIRWGNESSNPVPPDLIRNSTIWEIGLANIYKPATVSTTNPIIVTDTRLDPSRCGIISSISRFDTEALYTQMSSEFSFLRDLNTARFSEWFNNLQTELSGNVGNLYSQVYDNLTQFKNSNESQFLTWFENLQTQLSGDIAGNLQNQIGALPLLMTVDKTNIVNAINEVLRRIVPSTPTRSVSSVSSISLTDNPIPTSWQQISAGMIYQSSGYNITALGYTDGHEAYKAFDNHADTYWEANIISGMSLLIELPSTILIDKMKLQYEAPSASTLSIEYSNNGYEWSTDKTITNHASGETEITLGGHTAKYWRLNFSASGNTTVKVYGWKISDYTVTISHAYFTIDNLPNMVEGQTILVQIDPIHDATGIAVNSLNGTSIQSILQAGKKYELTYYTTHWTVKEVG